MIELTKDRKSLAWVLTKTDSEGFHHCIYLTTEELYQLADVLKILTMAFGNMTEDVEELIEMVGKKE